MFDFSRLSSSLPPSFPSLLFFCFLKQGPSIHFNGLTAITQGGVRSKDGAPHDTAASWPALGSHLTAPLPLATYRQYVGSGKRRDHWPKEQKGLPHFHVTGWVGGSALLHTAGQEPSRSMSFPPPALSDALV